MWTSDTMSVADSLMISLMGIIIVLSALALLAVMIVIFSKIFENLDKKNSKKQGGSTEVKKEGLSDEEIGSMIISVVCEDLCIEPDEIIVKSIKEIS